MDFARREGFTVRIRRSGSDAPAGVGFVVDERHIVTCAHVVNVALGRDKVAQERPGRQARLEIDFPMLGGMDGAPSRSCRVEVWVPPPQFGVAGGDIAGLAVTGDALPQGAGPARLLSEVVWEGTRAEVFGYPGDPPRQGNGARAEVHPRGVVGGGVVQLDRALDSAIRAQPGYSGSPLVIADEGGDAVAGMLAIASPSREDRDAYAIPVPQLAEAWPDIVGALTIPACPYRGLASFTPEDAALFVGREEEVSQLRQMVMDQPLVVVTGPSGVGKSSLINAGLIPALRQEGWLAPTPFRPGASPIDALAAALLTIERPGSIPTLNDLAEWTARLRSMHLTDVGSQLARLKDAPIILHADQLEEIFDASTCTADRAAEILELLLSTERAEGLGLHVVCTLRSDFQSHLLKHPDAGVRLQDRVVMVSPMGRGRLERVITEPAAARQVRYEDGLVSLIARHADSVGGLPLLEFALTELWPHQRKLEITLGAYQRIGGVSGALTGYAEGVYADLSERFGEDRIRRVLLALVRSRGGTAEATRRAASREQLGADWEVAQALASRRLLVVARDLAAEVDTAEIAHEALIREWPRYASWVDDDAEFQRWLAALEDGAAYGDLLADARIAEADRWLSERAADIPEVVQRLIADSKSEWRRRVAELEEARIRAESATRQAEARRLAAAAELALASRTVPLCVPISLAIKSLRTASSFEGDLALRNAIRLAPAQRARLEHRGPVLAVAFSPDGAWVATGSGDGRARVFDAATGAEVCRLDHRGPVLAVAFSPDGAWVATGSDGSARVFDAATGAQVCRLDHRGTVRAVAFSPDGSRVATSADGGARVFDAATGAEICRLDHTGPAWAVAFSPDGSRAVTGSTDGGARVFDAATGTEICRLDHRGPVWAVVFSPDGSRVATGSEDRTARVFDAATGAEVCRLDHRGPVLTVVVSPDGSRVATGSYDRTARVFDAATGTEICRLDHGGLVREVAFSPDGAWVATGSADSTARVFEAAADSEISCVDHKGPVLAVAVSPDGARVATGSYDRTARVFYATTGTEICRLDHGGLVRAVAFSPDGDWVATGSADGSARVFDAATGTEVARLVHGSQVRSVAFSPDGARVATGSWDWTARVFDAATGAEVCGLVHGGPVDAVAFSPDGAWVATGSADRTARVFNSATGAEVARLEHRGPVLAVAVSPDGVWVATGSADRTARVFVAETGAEVARLDHPAPVRAVGFSPDGARLATGSNDASARVFDAETGAEVCRLDHAGPVEAVVFSLGGIWVATGSNDRTARIWAIDYELLISQAEKRLTRNPNREELRRYFR